MAAEDLVEDLATRASERAVKVSLEGERALRQGLGIEPAILR